jgi:WD40 repeat protein
VAKIYLSSTYSDLKEYREIVSGLLQQQGHRLLSDAEFSGKNELLTDHLDKIDETDLFIALVAWSYGQIPVKGNPRKKSLVELEYLKAKSAGKATLTFLLHPDAVWPPARMDIFTGEGRKGKLIEGFRSLLVTQEETHFFKTEQDLLEQLGKAIATLDISGATGQTLDEQQGGTDIAWKGYLPFKPLTRYRPHPGESETLAELLFNQISGNRKLAITGEAGCGKTRVAIEFVHRHSASFKGGIFWLNASGTDFEVWQERLAEVALLSRFTPPAEEQAEARVAEQRAVYLCDYLASCPDALLVLDHADNPAALLNYLENTAGKKLECTIIFTCRNEKPLPGVEFYHCGGLPEEEAVSLLLDEILPSPEEEQERLATARLLCRKVLFLPAGILQLRAWLKHAKTHSLTNLLDLIQLEESGEKTTFASTTLDIAVKINTEQIGKEAQEFLRLLVVVPVNTVIPGWLVELLLKGGSSTELNVLLEWDLLEQTRDMGIYLSPVLHESIKTAIVNETLVYQDQNLFEERLVSSFDTYKNLEEYLRDNGFWQSLEIIRQAWLYSIWLGLKQAAVWFEEVLQFLQDNSYVLGSSGLWPEKIPGLFMQQLYNRALEEKGQTLKFGGPVPKPWVRQELLVEQKDPSLFTVLTNPSGKIYSATFLPDGNRLVSGSQDGIILLRNLEDGKIISTLRGHTAAVNILRVSHDGKLLVSGAEDKTVCIWDVESGKVLHTLKGHNGPVSCVDISSDNRLVLSGSTDGTIRFWNTANGQLLHTITIPKNFPVHCAVFSPDSSRILSGTGDGHARIWDIESGEELRIFDKHGDWVRCVSFSQDGSKLLTGSSDGTVIIWDSLSGLRLQHFKGHYGWILGAVFSPDSSRIFTASFDKTARMWDALSGECLYIFEGHNARIRDVAITPDSTRLLTASFDQTIRIWNIQISRTTLAFENLHSRTLCEEFSTDGSRVLMGSSDNITRLWNVRNGGLIKEFSQDTDEILAVTMAPDSSKVLITFQDNSAHLYDTATGTLLLDIEARHEQPVTTACFSPDGRFILTGSSDSTIQLWSAANGMPILKARGHEGWILNSAFSPDGKMFVTCSDDGTAKVWESPDGELISTLGKVDSWVWSAAFSPDSSKILTGSSDKVLRLWDTESGELISSLPGHRARIVTVAFSPDGRMAASGDEVGDLRFWALSSTGAGKPSGIYIAGDEIGAFYWLEDRVLLFITKGKTRSRPVLRRVKLESI